MPATSSKATMARALAAPDVLEQVRAQLVQGLDPNSPATLAAWLQAPSSWAEGPVLDLLLEAGLDCTRMWEGRGTALASRLPDLVCPASVRRLASLADHGAPLDPMAAALLAQADALDEGGAELLERAMASGFIPTAEQVRHCAQATEDEARCLALARHGHLDPNAPLEWGGQKLSYAQALLLYSRQAPCLADWMAIGADFSRPLPGGQLPAVAVLQPRAPGSDWAAPPISGHRLSTLRAMVDAGVIDWHAPDIHGETPIQALNALPGTSNASWAPIHDACIRQARVQRLEQNLAASPSLPSPPRL